MGLVPPGPPARKPLLALEVTGEGAVETSTEGTSVKPGVETVIVHPTPVPSKEDTSGQTMDHLC